jgi:hypothetical protein
MINNRYDAGMEFAALPEIKKAGKDTGFNS